MSQDLFSILLAVFLLFFTILGFVLISLRMRRKGGSLASVLFGATYEFYNQDKRHAVKEVVEQKSEKKKKEQESGDDEDEDDQSIDNEEIINKLYRK